MCGYLSPPGAGITTVEPRVQQDDPQTVADARMQQEPKLASYFEMHVRVYYHVDQH